MVKSKIRLTLTMLIILALCTGLVISTVDAKTSTSNGFGKSTSGFGKTASIGTIGTIGIPNIAVGFANAKAQANPTVGNRLSVYGKGLTVNDFSGFEAPTKSKATALDVAVVPVASVLDPATATSDADAISKASLKTGPTATGNSLAIPASQDIAANGAIITNPGLAYSTGTSTDHVTLRSFSDADAQANALAFPVE